MSHHKHSEQQRQAAPDFPSPHPDPPAPDACDVNPNKNNIVIINNNDNDNRAPASILPQKDDDGVERATKALASSSLSRLDLGALFAKLYPDLPEEDGLKASRNERLSKGYRSITLTYGEVSAQGFSDILWRIHDSYSGQPGKEGTFYDLGCGTGKPVFAAAATRLWQRCIGLEILSDLHGICHKALERWEGGIKDSATLGGSERSAAEIEFVYGDFTVLDWSDGDVVYANSTCFDDDLMKKLAQGAAALKEGAIVITSTDPIPSPSFEILEETVMVQAGRSATTCFIQRRLPKPPPAFGV